jgi:[ribosomal protein S18]-alanine N-acetyltransferase
MSPGVRLALRADVPGIAAMSRDEIEHGLPWSWTEARVLRALQDEDTNVAVIDSAGVLAGFGIMSYRDEVAHLLLFSVRRDLRRQGLGRQLLRWLEQVALEAGIVRISLECRRDNDAARNFYAENGYHELAISKGYYQCREDAIRLEKWLTPP